MYGRMAYGLSHADVAAQQLDGIAVPGFLVRQGASVVFTVLVANDGTADMSVLRYARASSTARPVGNCDVAAGLQMHQVCVV
jgi:hypothetical protein